MRYPFIIACAAVAGSMITGCEDVKEPTRTAPITREELLSNGFKEAPNEPGTFVATRVRLDALARALGFSVTSLRPTVSQRKDSDIRTVEWRGASLLVVAE